MIASLSAKRATSEVTRSESIGLLSHSGFFATNARRAFAFSLKRRTSCARSWNFLRDAGDERNLGVHDVAHAPAVDPHVDELRLARNDRRGAVVLQFVPDVEDDV